MNGSLVAYVNWYNPVSGSDSSTARSQPMHPLILLTGLLVGADHATVSPDAEIRVVTWYEGARPFETFRYRAYNVTRGEYTAAVDQWKALMARSYPGYVVSERDLRVSDGDASRAITAALEREKLDLAEAILAAHRSALPERAPSYRSYQSGFRGLTSPSSRPGPRESRLPRSFTPLGAANTVPSPGYLFPNPYPYPRPHP
jgi:hypothetical protein